MAYLRYLRGEYHGATMKEKARQLPVFLTAIEVADMVRLSPRTLEGMRLAGRGPPYIRMGESGRAKVIYKLEDVMAWIESHKER